LYTTFGILCKTEKNLNNNLHITLSDSMRARPITITLTNQALERLEELCEKSGLSKSDLIKMLILAQSEEIKKILRVGGECEVSKP
jgi:hypothetical protein